MPRIVVVGAGIGGLCAARALALAAHEPVVLERSPAGGAIGAGLVLWPKAVHALDGLGCGQAVHAVAAPARRAVFRGAGGGPPS
jgi:salicylate hydroxylase